nr:Chain B, p4B10 peptide [synthetic construct]
QLSDVPMDL